MSLSGSHKQIITQMTCRWDISEDGPWIIEFRKHHGPRFIIWVALSRSLDDLETLSLSFSLWKWKWIILSLLGGLDVGAAPELKVPSEFSYWEISLKSHFEMLPWISRCLLPEATPAAGNCKTRNSMEFLSFNKASLSINMTLDVSSGHRATLGSSSAFQF